MGEAAGWRMTPRAQYVLERAARLAVDSGMHTEDGQPIVGVEHVFVAVLQEEHSLPVQLIADQVDVPAMIELVMRAMRQESYQSPGSGSGADPGRE